MGYFYILCGIGKIIIMRPEKKKAKELVDKFEMVIFGRIRGFGISFEKVKQCALIAVGEEHAGIREILEHDEITRELRFDIHRNILNENIQAFRNLSKNPYCCYPTENDSHE